MTKAVTRSVTWESNRIVTFGVSAPPSGKSYYIYYIIFNYIIFNLIKKTRHTRATGVGFRRVTLSQPIPVPALPVPGTRMGLQTHVMPYSCKGNLTE